MKIAILHYSAAPVVGGVETVIQAHARLFVKAGLPLTIIAGKGESSSMPDGVDFVRIEEMDTQHPEIAATTEALNRGEVPDSFEPLAVRLSEKLRPAVQGFDVIIIHNILTKHFNLPLTAALFRLMDEGTTGRTFAWCHDLSWSSPHSRANVYLAYPWNLLKTPRENVTYVAVSEQRKKEVAETFELDPAKVSVVYDGIDPKNLYGLSIEGEALIARMDLLKADLILLMPVRITEAKNIELSIRLAAAIQERGIGVRVVVSGPPDPHAEESSRYFRSLLDLRKSLKVEDEVRFVYESGPGQGEGYLLDANGMAELYRVADAMLMPSHREGFGMPVLEAGLLGLPVISTRVPAATELAQNEVLLFRDDDQPEELSSRILAWMDSKPEHRLKARVRQNYTWESIFRKELLPLIVARQ